MPKGVLLIPNNGELAGPTADTPPKGCAAEVVVNKPSSAISSFVLDAPKHSGDAAFGSGPLNSSLVGVTDAMIVLS